MLVKEGANWLSNVNNFKLVSSYSRISSKYGGSCICVSKYLQTEEVNCFQAISKERDFKMPVVVLLDSKFILICIYRSPDGDFHIFLNNLEILIKNVQSKRKKLIFCGDWNINFMQDSVELQNLKNLLFMCNLINTVACPTRITNNTMSL